MKENSDYREKLKATTNKEDSELEQSEVIKCQKIIKSLESALKKAELDIETERLNAQKSGLKLRINTIENQVISVNSTNKSNMSNDNMKGIQENELKSLWEAIEDLNKLDADRESFILQNMTDLEHEIRDLKKSNDNLQAENNVLQKLQGIL